MAVSGLANLALKVADLDEAISFYESVGGTTHDRMVWNGSERADVDLGPLHLTLFTRAIYEDALSLPEECFLHPALFSDDLDADLAGQTVIWGPTEVEGPSRPSADCLHGGSRQHPLLELMEQLEDPPTGPS